MRSFYPEIQPFASGMLDVGDGHQIYWEQSGDPEGKPVVFLHGGPGGGTSPDHRRLFDPAKYRIVLFDQRGCGRSTPHVSEATSPSDLDTNTTWHLVADIERLREHLDIEKWMVFGGSWGSTLALAYAETHTDKVTELILRGIFTLRATELDWFYEGGAQAIAPDLWEGYMAPIDAHPRSKERTLIGTYRNLLWDEDPQVALEAAVAWSTWEASTITLEPRPDVIEHFAEPRQALAFARIENHYFVHRGWMEDGLLIRDADKLRDIPGVIVHGRYDLCTPAFTAWDLHHRWPEADLHLIKDAGHAFDEPGILDALITATDRFADAR